MTNWAQQHIGKMRPFELYLPPLALRRDAKVGGTSPICQPLQAIGRDIPFDKKLSDDKTTFHILICIILRTDILSKTDF